MSCLSLLHIFQNVGFSVFWTLDSVWGNKHNRNERGKVKVESKISGEQQISALQF